MSIILNQEQAMKKYKKLHPDKTLPHITPHVFRHTFCTNMANAGMDIRNLQYVMGYSDAGVTRNVYTHASFENTPLTTPFAHKFA